jgi:hypothetical protein
MAAIGRKGGQIGGKRRPKTMTKAQRSKIAVKASAAGRSVERPLVSAAVTMAGKTFNLRVGVADRSQMRYAVIIGRDILRSGDFLIDPSRRKKKT